MKRLALLLSSIIFCIVLLSTACAEESVIRILHVNDFHGFAEPDKHPGSNKMLGGAAYLAWKVNSLRSEKPSLLLAAGDMIYGNPWADIFQGKSVIDLMNAMQFDAMVLGNHEFDYGRTVLKQRISEARFPVLGADIQGFDMIKPYVIKEIGGIRVAIIGYVVTEYIPASTYYLDEGGTKFERLINIARRYARELKGIPPIDDALSHMVRTVSKYATELRGKVDIIVVLSHDGYELDCALARIVPGIDVIVGGHSHTNLPKPTIVNGTIIVQAWEHAKALGVLDLTVQGGKIVGYSGHLEEIMPAPGRTDKTVAKIIETYRKEADIILRNNRGGSRPSQMVR